LHNEEEATLYKTSFSIRHTIAFTFSNVIVYFVFSTDRIVVLRVGDSRR